MMRRLVAGMVLAALTLGGLPRPAGADPEPPDCAALAGALAGALGGLPGFAVTIPPAGPEAGWCVLDGIALRAASPGVPDLRAERLRLRATVADGALVGLEVDLAGLRVTPAAGDRALPDWLREMVRLQTATLRLALTADAAAGRVALRGGVLQLSGGTTLGFSGEARAAGLSLAALPGAALLALQLDWRNDGRLLRPPMLALGAALAPGTDGPAAVDAARLALWRLAGSLPDAALTEGSRAALDRLIAALPQGRGKAVLSLTAPAGIGAGEVLIAGMAADPTGPAALARLLQGSAIAVHWTPGLQP